MESRLNELVEKIEEDAECTIITNKKD